MTYLYKIISAALVAIFAENTIFARAMGTSTLILVSRKRKNLLGFGACVTYTTAITGIFSYFIDNYLFKQESEYSYIYKPLIYILTLGFVYIVTLLFLWKFMYKAFGKIKKYVHISAFNCAVLGAMFLDSSYCSTLSEYFFHGLGIGIGFLFAAYMTSIVYERIYSEDIPYCFRGFPLMMIYIGILSMAFYALGNHNNHNLSF
jgi:electron transport complex protein RnfA